MKDTKDIRLTNITKLARIITGDTHTTRRELAKQLGLSLMTVTTLVDQLLKLQLIVTLPQKSESKNGRKADLLTLNADQKTILVLDLRDYDFTCDFLDLRFCSQGESFQYFYDNTKKYEENLDCFLEQVEKQLRRKKLWQSILGISVVVPGPFQPETGGVMNKRIPELCVLNIKQRVYEHFPKSILFVDEDVKFTAYSLLEDTIRLEDKTVLYVYIGEGVGGGIINNLEILLGKNSIAGDMGQMMANASQNYEELLNIRHLYQEVMGVSGSHDAINLVEQLCAVKEKDPDRVMNGLKKCYKNLGGLLYNAIWMVNPHIVVIDCEYLSRLDSKCCEKVEKELKKRFKGKDAYMPDIPTIHFMQDGKNATYRGSGLKVLELYIRDMLCKNDNSWGRGAEDEKE